MSSPFSSPRKAPNDLRRYSSKGAAEVELIPAGMVLVNSNVFDILGYGFFGEALRSVFDPHAPDLHSVATLAFPVVRKKRIPIDVNASFSRHASVESVFVMKATEYRRGYNAVILRNAMPFHLEFGFLNSRVWNSWSKTHVWPCCIVMTHPFLQDVSNMSFADRNHEIQTFAACTTDQPFTKRIGVCSQLHLRSTVRSNIFR